MAGVDEAGLGPILGPLVVAGTALSGPEGTDPWAALSSIVCRDRVQKGKFRVADSKKVHSGKYGLMRLEHTVLAFVGAWRNAEGTTAGGTTTGGTTAGIPATLRDLLAMLGTNVDELACYPWYGDLDTALPVANDRRQIELDAHRLTKALDAAELRVEQLRAHSVDVAEFNSSIRATDNKSDTHFHAYCGVIRALCQELPDGSHLVADRCGGRMRYHQVLADAMPDRRIRTLAESRGMSRYELTRTRPPRPGAGGKSESRSETSWLTFAERAEDRAFPAALASCVAKYVRELSVQRLNAWFQTRVPELRRTAGYYTDGLRFLSDVSEIVEAESFPRDRLIRLR